MPFSTPALNYSLQLCSTGVTTVAGQGNRNCGSRLQPHRSIYAAPICCKPTPTHDVGTAASPRAPLQSLQRASWPAAAMRKTVNYSVLFDTFFEIVLTFGSLPLNQNRLRSKKLFITNRWDEHRLLAVLATLCISSSWCLQLLPLLFLPIVSSSIHNTNNPLNNDQVPLFRYCPPCSPWPCPSPWPCYRRPAHRRPRHQQWHGQGRPQRRWNDPRPHR